MKNLLYTSLLFLFFSTTIMAQLQQGSLFLSGRLSIQSINQDGGLMPGSAPFLSFNPEVSSTGVEVAPSLGYLFSGNLAGGLELSYAYTSTSLEQSPASSFFPQTQESSLRLFSVRPFLRYYKSFSDKLGLQLDIFGGLGFGSASADRIVDINGNVTELKEDISSFELGLSPGIYYFISPRFMIDASIGGIGYESEKAKPEGPGLANRQNSRFYTFVDSGIGLRVGVNLFFHSARN